MKTVLLQCMGALITDKGKLNYYIAHHHLVFA